MVDRLARVGDQDTGERQGLLLALADAAKGDPSRSGLEPEIDRIVKVASEILHGASTRVSTPPPSYS